LKSTETPYPQHLRDFDYDFSNFGSLKSTETRPQSRQPRGLRHISAISAR